MRNVLVSTLFFIYLSLASQNNAVLVSPEGKAFKLTVNGKIYNEIPQAQVTLYKITKDTVQLEFEFENKKKLPATIYLLEKGKPCKDKEFNYRVNFNMTSLSLQFMGFYDTNPLPEPLVPKAPVTDTSLNFKNRTFGHFCELKDGRPSYFNNIPQDGKCLIAMPSEYLNYIALLISKATRQESKFSILENVCTNNCLDVDQLNKLLNYIEYEVEKLKLVRVAYFNLVDPANQKRLEKSFRFEASINELNDFFKNSENVKHNKESDCEKAASQMIVDAYAEKLGACLNDAERLEVFKKSYAHLCYSINQVELILNKFIHDREKLEAAKLLYFNCVEKEKYSKISYTFSYNQSALELKSFTEKQRK